jgi:tetratricopeptide (TPR) repeat protein
MEREKMKKISKAKKWALVLSFAFLVLAAEWILIAPFFAGGGRTAADRAVSPCARVVSVLEGRLEKIGDDGEAADYLERAKILNRLSIEACGEGGRREYFARALAELAVADALRVLDAQTGGASQKTGFYWKERAEFFRMHAMHDRELEVYEKYLSIPGRGRDVYPLVKKAEVLARIGRADEAAMIYADVAEICGNTNNSNCYVAGAQFADLLEANADNREIFAELRRKWPKDTDFRELFRYNGDAAARLKNMLK